MSRQTYYIYGDENTAAENAERQQLQLIDNHYPDRVIIAAEMSSSLDNVLIVNEEDDSFMCMEYTNLN